MKRILAMLLTVAMIATACPMAFADEVTEESNIAATENLSAEAPEAEENIEESPEDPTAENAAEDEATVQEGNISLFAAENEISTGNGLLIDESEAEYSYECLIHNDPNYGKIITGKGTFQEAVTAIKNNGNNSGTITLLKDVVIDETIAITNAWTIKAKDGETHTISRAADFTGPMVSLSGSYAPTIGSENGKLILDGGNADNTDSLIKITKSGANGITLLNLELKNNNSEKGGAINTTDAAVSAKNITINNCSAVDGGAIYWSLADTNNEEVTLTNSIIKSNTADTGSAIFIKNDNNKWGKLVLNGCTFENNTFSNSESNTDRHTKSTTIYFDNAATSANQYSHLDIKGETKFDNTTNSDIMLDHGLATSTSYANLQVLTGFSNTGGSIKVAVGDFSRNNTTGNYVINDNGATSNVFSLVGTYGKPDTGNYILGRYGNYLTVKEPVPQRINFKLNSDKITNYSIEGETVTYLDAYGNALSQGSLSMSSVAESGYVITATPGHTVTFTANLNTGYQVKAVTVTGVSGSAVSVTKVDGTTYTFVMPNEEVTVDATVRKSSSIKVVQPESGSITVTVPDMTMVDDKFTAVEDGTTVTLSATGDDFGKWSIVRNSDSKDITTQLMASNAATSKNTSFTMPPYDITITAKVKHDITVNAAGGTYKVVKYPDTSTAITKAVVGDKIWVDLTPNTNYKLTGVTINKAGGETVSYETYYDNNFHDDASLLASGCMVQFYMPDEAVTINVTFELDACEITTSAAHGTISGITSPAPIGSEVVFTLTPDTYYELDTFTVKDSANEDVNCTYDSTSDSYSFTMPASNVSINAVFKKKQYTVTTSGGNVTFSVSADKYTWGDTVKFKAEPAEWYSIKQVYTNNSTVTVTPVDGEANTYSFTMPQGDITITAVTERPNHNVTFVTNGGSPVDGQVIPNGDTVTKPTTPKYVNHGFAGWYTSQTFEAGTKYDSAANVTDDVTLYARWFLWGDVNLDGDANSMDALLINRCRIGAISYDSLNCQMAARVNDVTNTTPNSMDALLINRHRIGAIAKYPVETQTAGYEFDIETNTFITNQ